MKRIVIIDHFCKTPDETGNNRFIYLAELLCSKGVEVEVITTTFSHIKKQQREKNESLFMNLPYKFTMLPEPGYPKNVCIKRFFSHFVFGKNLAKYLERIIRPDLVLISVPSLDVGEAARKYCKKHNIPFIVDIQDLWPEAFKLVFNIPIISDLIFMPMTFMANRIYAQADRVIAVSELYKQRGLQSNHKDKQGLCVYLGTDLDRFDSFSCRSSLDKNENEIWIAYVGTLGHSYNLEIIFDALNKISDKINQKVEFHILGDGPYLERFMDYSKGCKLECVFHGRLDYASMVSFLVKCDIAVNPIAKGAAQSVINKHADYAAAGLPVVNTQECVEYRNMISKYQCGINCEVSDTKQVAEAILLLISNADLRTKMGKASRKMAEECFDRKETYKNIINSIETLT